jgi:hypothetical protein
MSFFQLAGRGAMFFTLGRKVLSLSFPRDSHVLFPPPQPQPVKGVDWRAETSEKKSG